MPSIVRAASCRECEGWDPPLHFLAIQVRKNVAEGVVGDLFYHIAGGGCNSSKQARLHEEIFIGLGLWFGSRWSG
jgi:hypothetical protein